MYGFVPRPGSRSCARFLGEILLTCLVPHRIAPGEFLSGGFYVQAPFLFSFTLPVKLCGATQSFGEKLCLAQAVTVQALVYRWAGSVGSVCCLSVLELLCLFWGTCALVSLLKTEP